MQQGSVGFVEGEDLGKIFTLQEQRKVSENLTLNHKRVLSILEGTVENRGLRGHYIALHEHENGTLTIGHAGAVPSSTPPSSSRSIRFIDSATRVARLARLRVYDAVYVALALNREATLLTLDTDVRAKMAVAFPGISLVSPSE